MSRQRKGRGVWVFRLLTGVSAICLGFFIGCGNLGGGCEATGNGNDNTVANANDNTSGNDNGGTGGNDNGGTGGNENRNDNSGGVGNDNGGTAGNDNSGTGGNDNSGTGGNDNGTPGNDNTGNTNQNGNGNQNTNANGNGNTNANLNVNSNTSSNTNTNGGGGGNTNTNSGPVNVMTRSSGAAQPGMTVTLFLDEDLPASCEAQALWSQTGGMPLVALTNHGAGGGQFMPGSATFMAPAVPATTNLTFRVDIPAGCAAGEPARTGSVIVPIQVADLVFNLPVSIQVGASLNLTTVTMVSGAPNDFLALYFTEDPLPQGVDADINQFNSTLTVHAGAGRTLRVTCQIFGAAGLLAEASDTINIVGP